jgi:hypothetical protein
VKRIGQADAGDFVLESEPGKPKYRVPAGINEKLRDYQRVGVQFLFNLHQVSLITYLARKASGGSLVMIWVSARLCRPLYSVG